MIELLTLLLLAAPCKASTPLSEAEARTLVLNVPNARRSMRERGAKLDAEIHGSGPDGFLFRVYATNTTAPSNLIGYYFVDRKTAEVTDGSSEPPDKPQVSTHLRSLQRAMLRTHCRR